MLSFPSGPGIWNITEVPIKFTCFLTNIVFPTSTQMSLRDHSQAGLKLLFHDPLLKKVASLTKNLLVLLIMFLIFYSLGSSLDMLCIMK